MLFTKQRLRPTMVKSARENTNPSNGFLCFFSTPCSVTSSSGGSRHNTTNRIGEQPLSHTRERVKVNTHTQRERVWQKSTPPKDGTDSTV